MALDDKDRFRDLVDDVHEIRNNTKKTPEPGPGCSEALGCNPGCLLFLLIAAGIIAFAAEYIHVYF